MAEAATDCVDSQALNSALPQSAAALPSTATGHTLIDEPNESLHSITYKKTEKFPKTLKQLIRTVKKLSQNVANA